MSGAIRVLLPASAAHLATLVQQAGCIAVIDATSGPVPEVPDGAWVRTRPGRPAPGNGPVILAEFGAPLPDRETWLETAAPRAVPKGYAGLVLKGREAGGFCGEFDGLEALAACPEPGRVLLDAGVGPRGAGAAAALGGAGVLLVDTWLACPEVGLPLSMEHRLNLPDDEITQVVGGLRVGNSATSSAVRKLAQGEDVWSLAEGVYGDGDIKEKVWLIGQGAALARGLADRHGTLGALLQSYADHWKGWRELARQTVAVDDAVPVHTTDALNQPGTAASTGGVVGSAVLWEMAGWLGRPVHGGPALAAVATGNGVVGDAAFVAKALSELSIEAPISAPDAPVAPVVIGGKAAAVAIIGIGCRFPGADNLDAYWNNILNGVNSIGEVPTDRWDPALYFDDDQSAPDKTYTKIGAFLSDQKFDSKRFRIPPKVVSQIDPVQQITLTCVADALDDANLKVDRRSDGREFNRDRCAVILGNSLGGEVGDEYAIRLNWHSVKKQLTELAMVRGLDPAARDAMLKEMEASYLKDLPIINEDSMPGELANVIAGRIANAFDLGGANFTVDAACASSMAALQSSMQSLQSGDCDMVVTGGTDRSMNIATYVKFCKIGALSPDHSSPFDVSANGFVMGEGCGILVLKRYEDAVRDGDKIYSVIRGIGASSDGKGKGITAPNIKGQLRALNRAYEAAGFGPHEVDLMECHGTSTVVGDKVEVEALNSVIGGGLREERGPIRIGSVKSMIGHLKSAAGAASCIKAAMALHHGVLPPSIGFKTARPDVPLDVVPLQVQTHAEAWPETPNGLRRAGVSAFGFGGTNFHIVMESYAGQALPVSTLQSRTSAQPPSSELRQTVAQPVMLPPPASIPAPVPLPRAAVVAPVIVAPRLPEGVWATSGVDRAELLVNLKRIAAGQPAPFHPSAPVRIAAASRDAEEREGQLKRAIKSLEKNGNPDMLRARAIHLEEQAFDGKVALLFTGQGSQYLDMGLDLARAYPIVQATFDEADRILAPTLGRPITDYIRLRAGEDKAAKSDLLRQTEYSQPATLTLDIAILRLLASYGVSPDLVAGHSLGEYGAAVAAGVMTFEQALMAVSARGREMANIRLDDPGKMAGIAASTDVVEAVLAEVDGYVIAANKNCPSQTVIAGASDAVEEASERFKARGVTVYPLPVSHAFHSEIVAPASEPLRGVLAKLGLQPPRRPITTNVTGEYYPTGPNAVPEIIDLLAQQISAPVEWVAQMERMYEDGARVFIEVGPKRALAGFTVAILKRRPHRALYTNHPKRGGVASFRDSLAGLLAFGFSISAEPAPGPVDLFAPSAPRLATSDAVEAFAFDARPDTAHQEPLLDIHQGVLQIVADATGYELDELELDYELEADLGIDTVKQAEIFSAVRAAWSIPEDADFDMSQNRTLGAVIAWASSQVGGKRISVAGPTVTPVPAPVAAAPVAVAPVTASPLMSDDVMARFLRDAATAGMSGSNADGFARAMLPAVQGLLAAAFAAAVDARPAAAPVASVAPAAAARPVMLPGSVVAADLNTRVVCTGASVGLPGGDEVFGASNFTDILSGQNRISHIGDRAERFLEKGIVRLVKDSKTGQGSFLPVEEVSQVIRLAGLKSHFDLKEWGVAEGYIRALDIATQLAFAAGIEALRDAGIPLVRDYKTSASGKRVPQGWKLPQGLRDSTAVIFASAFPGYDQLIESLQNNGNDGEGHFDRRFLFQVLAMGHSQFAQFIGARGPNAAVNAACASTTQAVAMAEDWLRLGRCERVIVVGADDVTSERMLPWIGSGFMAAGAATTHDVIEEAALPFDRRRHGMILGMGAVGLVLERADGAEARGVVPVAELAGAMTVNSAFHGTRLDTDHISGSMKLLVDQVCVRSGVTSDQIADSAFFVSHETYTPARGGSAAAEIGALKAAFGDKSANIIIANTKGFTGHAMGAGIEDAVAVKALQYGIIPPVANLREPDPDLGPLRLSRGERVATEWCVRLAAGFGSQLAVSIWRRSATGDNRVANEARRVAWLKAQTGYKFVQEEVNQRTLRVVEGLADSLLPMVPEVSPANTVKFVGVDAPVAMVAPVAVAPLAVAAVAAMTPAPAPTNNVIPMTGGGTTRSFEQVLAELTEVIAEKTGYEPEELESDFELEADLGIDTVKQAEILSDLTDRYGLSRDDDFKMADYPTIEALAAYLISMLGVSGPPPSAPSEPIPEPVVAATPVVAASPAPEVAPAPVPVAVAPVAPVAVADAASGAVLEPTLPELISVVAEKTGYEPEELESDFELEADLGVDTVKQAEIISALQEHYQLPPDDDFSLADHPTLGELATYLDGRRALVGGVAVAAVPVEVAPAADTPVEAPLNDDENTASGVQPSSGREWVADEFDLKPLMTDEQVILSNAATLPDPFRVRRPVLVEHPVRARESLQGRHVLVLGDGTMAEAVRDEVLVRGGSTEAPYDTVLDVADDVKKSFVQAQSMEPARPGTWLTLTRLGDFAGIYPLDRAFVDGARAGFTKSIGREWEGTQAKVVDVPASELDATAARTFCDELGTDAATEVWQREGVRRVIEYRVEEPPQPGVLSNDSVVLVTGGGRGICARIATEIASRGTVRLALVGRGAAGENPLDEKAEKARIKAELKAAGERGTPAQINQQLNPLRKADEIRLTLEGIRALDCEVAYYRADMADSDAVKELVEQVESDIGPVDYCIHGAGAEESRLIQDKDDKAFHRVFDGKARGGQSLIDALPEGCFFVSMGSVAGRFGNPGQVDYAAANDAMARLCLTRPHSLHVDWTAWDDVGMAARGGMKHLLEERGVDMLPAAAGAGLLVDMMASRVTGEVVVAGGLGDFLPAPSHPLLDRVEMDGDTVRAFHELTLKNDPWILDHAIDGVAVLPGVIGLEMMAAAGSLCVPGFDYVGARNVRFNAPVKVHGDRVTEVLIEAAPTPRPNEVRARLISVRKLRTGRVTRTEHFSATLLFGEASVTNSLPSAFLPDEPISQTDVYARFFHGPIFQVLAQVFGVSEDGLVAEASVEPGKIAEGLITEPLVLESAFQAAGLHQMVVVNKSGLPMEIDEVVVLSPANAGQPYSLTVRLCGEHYDVDVDGPSGPLMRVRGFRLIERGPLPAGDRFPVPDGGRPVCFPAEHSVASSSGGRSTAQSTPFDQPSDWLTVDELEALHARGTARRIRDRLAGRIAAKRALSQLTGVAPLEIRIHSAESGEPIAVVPQWPGVRVSISHRDGVGVAVAVDGGRVGVDLETIEARPEHFAQTWFSEAERLLCGLDPVRQTALWSVKEAVLKVLGTGMALSPKDIQVQSLRDGHALVRLQGAAARRLTELGGGQITVSWAVSERASLVAEARIAA